MPDNEKQDVYTRITNRIVASLEQGVLVVCFLCSHRSSRIFWPCVRRLD